MILACQGLPLGEIRLILPRFGAFTSTVEQLAQLVLEHKINKLRGRGLEYIAAPDVHKAAGLEQLEKRLEVIAALLKPEATDYGLKFPTGMVLWGPPSTGKSLCAKLAAQKMGLPLLMANWGILLGSPNPDRALKEFISLVTSLAPCVLYWDDFDKGFAGWDSNADGGVAYPLIIPVRPADEKRAKESEALWETQVPGNSQVTLLDTKALTQALYDRIDEAERMLPLPSEELLPSKQSTERLEADDVLDNFPKHVFQAPGLQ